MFIEEYRALKEKKYAKMMMDERKRNPAQKVSIHTAAGIVDGYIYLPEHTQNKNLPVMFNLHGGGFVLGFCEQDGKYCKILADKAGCAVININYCLAPENKFPIPVTSAYEFICKLTADFSHYNFDPSRIVIGGHSAGANIAAAITLLARENWGPRFVGQILDYPPLNFSDTKYDERDLGERMNQYIDWYFSSESDRYDILASPLMANLGGLPKALIISAGLDPLCPEAEAYAAKLDKAGVQVRYYCFENRMHGFTHDIFTEEYHEEDSEKAWTLMAKFLINSFQ